MQAGDRRIMALHWISKRTRCSVNTSRSNRLNALSEVAASEVRLVGCMRRAKIAQCSGSSASSEHAVEARRGLFAREAVDDHVSTSCRVRDKSFDVLFRHEGLDQERAEQVFIGELLSRCGLGSEAFSCLR